MERRKGRRGRRIEKRVKWYATKIK